MDLDTKTVLVLCKDTLVQRHFESFPSSLNQRLRGLCPKVPSLEPKEFSALLREKTVEFDSIKALMTNLVGHLSPDPWLEDPSLMEQASAPFFGLDQFAKIKELKGTLIHLMAQYKVLFVYKTRDTVKQQLVRLLFQEKLEWIPQDALSFEIPSKIRFDAVVTSQLAKEVQGDLQKVVYYSNLNYSSERKIRQLNGISMKDLGDRAIVSMVQLPLKLKRMFDEQLETPSNRVIRVGYAFAPKKLAPFLQTDFLFDKPDTIYTPMDFRVPSSPEVDVIIHKYSNVDPKATHINELEAAFDEFCAKTYPLMPERDRPMLIDPVHGFDKILSRSLLHDFLCNLSEKLSLKEEMEKICMKKGFGPLRIKTPRHVILPPGKFSEEEISSVIEKNNMNYPVFVKTVNAASTKESHLMGIALTPLGAQELEANPVFQEFEHIVQETINHDQVVFKVYVLGDLVQINKRKSVPNADYNPADLQQHSFFFHSQSPFKEMGIGKGKYCPEEINLDEEIVLAIQRHIHEELGLSLYGFDILRETKTGDYCIVDINYFPGYKGIDPIGEKLLDHLKKKANFRTEK